MKVLLIVLAVVATASVDVAMSDVSTAAERLERAALHWNIPDSPHIHEGIAWMAEQLTSFTAVAQARKLLGGPMADSASWADTLRTVAPTRPWAADLHFIDLPTYACSYDPAKDCHNSAGQKGFCADGGIQNYTARLTDPKLDNFERTEALKFLIHLVGDIHCPLHVGNEVDLGGNKLKGTFLGNPPTTLHNVWDGDLARIRVATDFGGNATAWMHHLLRHVRVGRWRAEAPKWLQCARSVKYGHCSDQWGRESAKLACLFGYVLPDGTTKITDGFALDQSYYERNIPVLERQIVKAAVRLANVLSMIWPDVDVPSPNKVAWVRKLDREVRWVNTLQPRSKPKLRIPTIADLNKPTRPW